ncbi:MAG TPA: outer membrane beta-barrel protein [Flavisolibacter sp.]|jgi:hypothetical protein|nr:outer membrane beta-barrel protein [Flavisolibacter sp.]
MRGLLLLAAWLLSFCAAAQKPPEGELTGTVADEKGQAMAGASVQLISFSDSTYPLVTSTDKTGSFQFTGLKLGYYSLRLSFVGYTTLRLDSIHLREDRYLFNLNDLVLKQGGATLDEIVIYAEKPLIQSREGNITFNAAESPLSAGSNASDLLTNVPLVTKDPTGKLLVRGKEPKILIDDKPVELNLQQLQDLLESLPGSTIEKIEVLTNPPPQYANEQGGVINIVTKKGTMGFNGRVTAFGGTRGEAGVNASFNYRKQGFSLNLNTGFGYNYFEGMGYSNRQNSYADSSNYFRTDNTYQNRNLRPNIRANINYDLDKWQSLNAVLQYNQNRYDNRSQTTYTNLDRFQSVYRLSDRSIKSTGDGYNPNISLSYSRKAKRSGGTIKIITNLNTSSNTGDRDFYQQFLNPDKTFTGLDSTQQQRTDNQTLGYSLRLNYDQPLANKKTVLSSGAYLTHTRSDIEADASYRKRADGSWATLEALTNQFRFTQQVTNLRTSVKQLLAAHVSATAGLAAEQTSIHFDLYKTASDTANRYWSLLPFANMNLGFPGDWNLTVAYRRTIRRPGINELNPTIDFSDPYNIRFGNPSLEASGADNFDLVLGKTKNSSYGNIGLGYNIVSDIYTQVRELLADGRTQLTWQNISGRKEYEASTWNGYSISKFLKLNFSASYTYSTYSSYDKLYRNFRNGGSLSSNLNLNYIWRDLYTTTGSFTFNRFANPQGTVKSTLSMNIGLQAKLAQKKLVLTLNLVDPFLPQQNRTYTYGTNFTVENYSETQTKNYRLSVGYNFNNAKKKKPKGLPLKKG